MSKQRIEVFPGYGALCHVNCITALLSLNWQYVDSMESEDGMTWDVIRNVKTGEYAYTDLSFNEDW